MESSKVLHQTVLLQIRRPVYHLSCHISIYDPWWQIHINIGCAVEILLLLSTAEPQHGTMRCPKCSCGRIVSISELAMLDSWSLDSPGLSPFGGWSLVTLAFAAKQIWSNLLRELTKTHTAYFHNLTSSPESQLEVPHGLMNRNLDSGWYLQGSKKPESLYSRLYMPSMNKSIKSNNHTTMDRRNALGRNWNNLHPSNQVEPNFSSS